MRDRWLILVLLLLLWGSRLSALDLFPLHNDEGLHLTRAVEVWRGHPFWQINDGKFINHFLIAALYPQHDPVFTARIATLLVMLPGMAAAYALARHLFGSMAGLLAGIFWLASPYLFFYERLALSDAQAAALVVVTAWAAVLLAERGRRRDAIRAGASLAAAALFKLTAAPFALLLGLIIFLMGRVDWRRRIENLLTIAAVGAVMFSVPLLYLLLRSSDFLGIALDWVGTDNKGGGGGLALGDNLTRLWAQLTGFGLPLWTALLLIGLVLLAVVRDRHGKHSGGILLLAACVPASVIIVLGREVLPRHYVVALPLALTFAGMGIGGALNRLPNVRLRQAFAGIVALGLVGGMLPFMLRAYDDPANLRLPQAVRREYVTEQSAGYGLREAVQAFPQTLTRADLQIVASMYPDSCRRANFYVVDKREMVCTDAPGRAAIETALAQAGAVYVLREEAPDIGLDFTMLDATATHLAAYPRPGETEATASVVLWLLETND